MSANLIMGAAAGYGVDELRVLLRSAKTHVPSADVLLFTDSATPEFEERLRQLNPRVRLAPIPDADRRKRTWRSARRRRKLKALPPPIGLALQASLLNPSGVAGLAALHSTSARHFWHLKAIREGLIGDARKILLVDTRDVFFQDDPFERAPDASPGLLMGSEPRWVDPSVFPYQLTQKLSGGHTAARMIGHPVLCAGVILGRPRILERYLRAMCWEFIRHGRHLFGRAYDQPSHCKVLLADRCVPFEALPEGNDWVAHLLYVKQPTFRLTQEAFTTLEGRKISIVHRYDRVPGLKDWVEWKYGTGERPGAPPLRRGGLVFPDDFDYLSVTRSELRRTLRNAWAEGRFAKVPSAKRPQA